MQNSNLKIKYKKMCLNQGQKNAIIRGTPRKVGMSVLLMFVVYLFFLNINCRQERKMQERNCIISPTTNCFRFISK